MAVPSQIRVPYTIATHIQRKSGTASLNSKSKAASIIIDTADGNRLKYKAGTSIVSLYTSQDPAVASGGTSRILTAANQGTTNLFDSAAGISYALPTPVAGMEFDFFWTVSQSSATHVVTAGAGVFLLGGVAMFSGLDVTPSSTLGPKYFQANGSSHIQYTSNATTTGSAIGSWLSFKALSATVWMVKGVIDSPSGSIATPFSA